MPNRRTVVVLLGALGIISLLSILLGTGPSTTSPSIRAPIHHVQVDDDVLKGDVISSKIGNETVKCVYHTSGISVIVRTV